MKIDDLYRKIDKNNYFLGLVTEVYSNSCVCQIENLTLLKNRRIKMEYLTPSTINYYAVIDSEKGVFIGKVYQSKIQNRDSIHYALGNFEHEKIFPEVSIDIIGLLKNGEKKFKSVSYYNVGLTDKVYIANSEVLKKYLESVELKKVDEGKNLEPFAKVLNMSNQELCFCPETLLDRHLLTIGATNSGKSTSSLAIIDKLFISGIKILLIDPTGEYNESFSDQETKITKCKLGTGIKLGVGKVSIAQWAMLFELNESSQPAVLAEAITSLRYQKKNNKSEPYKKTGKSPSDVERDMQTLTSEDLSFDLNLLPKQINEEAIELCKKDDKYDKSTFKLNNHQWLLQKVNYKLDNSKFKDFFTNGENKTDLLEIIDAFISDNINSLYIDASEIGMGDGIGTMLIDIISNYVINKKNKNNIAFVIFIDEVHRYSSNVQPSKYPTGLTLIAREGRKKGIFLFLTTQNPKDVSGELLGQIGSLLVHRMTHKAELDAIITYMGGFSFKQIPKLQQGECILTSINLIEDLHLKVEPCNRKHKNSTISF